MTALAIKVLLSANGVPAAAAAVAASIGTVTATAAMASDAMEQTATSTNAAQAAFESANSSAKSWAIGLLGVASAGAVMTSAIKAASDAEQRLGIGRDAEKSAEPVKTLAHSYGQLKDAVEKAYETFGTAFAQSANLQQTMDMLRAAVHNVTKVLGFLGGVLGAVFNYLVNGPPYVLALVAALKVLTVAIVFIVQYLITKWIIGWVTLHLLGVKMTSMLLLKTAVTWGLSVAYAACTAAVWLLNAAIGALMIIGLPLWAAIAAVVAVVAVAIAAVVAIVWGLVKAWEAFTTNDEEADKIAKLEEFQEKAQGAIDKVKNLNDELQKKIDQNYMSDMEKDLDDHLRKIKEAAKEGGFGPEWIEEQMAMRRSLLEQLAALEKQNKEAEAANKRFEERKKLLAETVAMQDDLDTKVEQLGWTEQQKALDDFVAKLDEANLLTDEQRTAAIAQYEATLGQLAAGENRLKVEKEIADLQKAAAEVGMTDAERRIAALQALGATAEQIATAQAALDKKNAAEEKAKLVERGKQLTDSLATPAEKYRQKMAEISKLLANKAISDQTALKAADAAAKEYESSLANNQQGREISSPQALLRGTAEALLAADRQKNPIDKLTDIQRQALKEAKEQTDIQRTKLQEIIDGDQTVDFN